MNMKRSTVATASIIASLALLAACGGGGGSTTSPLPGGGSTPTPAPTATPQHALQLSKNTLTFTSNAPQTIVANDTLYTGTFSANGCANIVTVTPANASGPQATLTVTPVGAGTCTLTVAESNGMNATISITATLTQGTIQ